MGSKTYGVTKRTPGPGEYGHDFSPVKDKAPQFTMSKDNRIMVNTLNSAHNAGTH
jgi:hypothetical protein